MNPRQSSRPSLPPGNSQETSPPACARRSIVLAALLAVSLPARGASAAGTHQKKETAPPDVALYCDPTLAPAMRQVGALFQARTGAPVAVLSAPPPLMLAQIERQTRDDVLVSLASAVEDGVSRGLLRLDTRFNGWRNRLVLAARAGEVSPFSATDPGALARSLGNGRFAVTDPTVAAAFDGPAVLGRLGLAPALAGKVVGAADTADVAFLVKTGAAQLGLLYLTDVRADSALAVAATLDSAAAPTTYATAMNRQAQSPNAQAFLDFLRTPEAAERLRAQGLETTA